MWAKTGPQLRRLPMYHCRLLEGQVLWCGSSLGNRPWQVDHVVLLHIEEGLLFFILALLRPEMLQILLRSFFPRWVLLNLFPVFNYFLGSLSSLVRAFAAGNVITVKLESSASFVSVLDKTCCTYIALKTA